MLETNVVYRGNCVDVMAGMPDNCIDLTVTSPPYDGLRTYNGYDFDFKSIADQLYRITKQGGVVVWVVGDETKKFCESLSSFSQAFYFYDIGFNLLDTMIYYKENYALAYPTLRRYANQFEYMFVFTKGRPNTFNPIQVKKTRMSDRMSKFRQKDGTWVHKKIEANNKETKDASNVWSYPVGFKNLGHPAVFPESLARDHILSWSNPGDIVLDPMAGSGTTLKMARENERKYIGIEISQEYIDIINNRLDEEICLTTKR
jgi:DNA modification methylase